MELTFSDQMILTIVDKALIGGLLGLGAYFFSRALEKLKSTQALELEAFKLHQNQEFEKFKNYWVLRMESDRGVRAAVGEVARRVAAGNQAICFTAWFANNSPKSFNIQMLAQYDDDSARLLNEIVVARVALASLAPPVHVKITPFVQKLYDLDQEMSKAKAIYEENPADGLRAVAKLHGPSLSFEHELLSVFAEAMANCSDDTK